MQRVIFLSLMLLLAALSGLTGSVEMSARRIQAHLLVGDPKAAVNEAKAALQNYPQEPLAYCWAIRSLAASGEDFEMMEVWEQFYSHFEEEALEQDLLEEMCWGILKKGREAPGITPQLISLIGSALTQDMRGVPFLLEGMRHTNAHIRAIAVQLGAHYGDHPLREEICRLFRQESVLDVRLKVIEALGKLQLEVFLPDLIQSIGNPRTGAKEKLAAIEAIVQMRDCIGKEELKILAASKRAGLRQLACEVIATCELDEESDLLLPLMCDPQPEVCAAALKSWGLLRKKATSEIKRLALEALDPTVGVTAAWVWLIDDPIEGERGMMRWLEHEELHVRALAAAAVGASGPYGTGLAKKMLTQTQDLYVQANLAIALARQREECDQVGTILEQALQNSCDKWMLSENGLFDTLEKSNLSHNPTIPNYPEVVDQTVRLEILNLLAILESPKALEAIKAFLKERTWKVTGLAAETLLGEGDETAIDLVRELLQDPDQEIRLEAALVLASWGRDYSATETLLEVYPKADRQLQLKILESLGRIGDKKVISFLLKRLKEPSLLLRMVAASILIQTLNC
jgi:HEAT repeat protein